MGKTPAETPRHGARVGLKRPPGDDAPSNSAPDAVGTNEPQWAAPHPTAFGTRPFATALTVRRSATRAPFIHIGDRA